MQKQLTAEQEQAIVAYAAQHGRRWKQVLRNEWMRASAGPVLHSLRNTHGPRWLATYTLPR